MQKLPRDISLELSLEINLPELLPERKNYY